jgi:hypothetical protein
MTHENFREMLPLYVIGALDGDELYNFERYVAENRVRCSPEITQYQVVADEIALAAEPAQPSPAVYERIAGAIEEVKRPAVAAAPVSAPTPAPAPVPAPTLARPAVVARPEKKSFNLGVIIFRLTPWAAAAVLVVLLFGAHGQIEETTNKLQSMTSLYNDLLGKNNDQQGKLSQQQGSLTDISARLDTQTKLSQELKEKVDQLVAKNNDQQRDLVSLRVANKELADEKDSLLRAADQMREQLEKQTLQTAALQKRIDDQTGSLDVMMDPTTRIAPLADPKAQTKAVAKVYWQATRKTGFMVVSNLIPVAPHQGKCLELWAICGNDPPVPAGIGWTDDSGHGMLQVKLAKDMTCMDKFAVTIEQDGGSPTPEGPIVLSGQ